MLAGAGAGALSCSCPVVLMSCRVVSCRVVFGPNRTSGGTNASRYRSHFRSSQIHSSQITWAQRGMILPKLARCLALPISLSPPHCESLSFVLERCLTPAAPSAETKGTTACPVGTTAPLNRQATRAPVVVGPSIELGRRQSPSHQSKTTPASTPRDAGYTLLHQHRRRRLPCISYVYRIPE